MQNIKNVDTKRSKSVDKDNLVSRLLVVLKFCQKREKPNNKTYRQWAVIIIVNRTNVNRLVGRAVTRSSLER